MAVSKHIVNIINDLKEANLETTPYEDIKSKLLELGQHLIFRLELPIGTMILRSRTEHDSHYFKYEQEISYIKDCEKIKMGRANFERNSIFYGSLPLNGNHGLCEVTCYWEASKIIFKDEISEGLEYSTMGKWKIIKPFNVCAIVQNNSYKQSNQMLSNLNLDYKVGVKNYLDNEDNFNYISEFIASEFSKVIKDNETYHYKISCAYSEILYENGVQGIVYPSVKGEGSEFNIAVTPSTVDKNLQLDRILMAKVYKKGKQLTRDPYLECNNFHADGMFIWKEAQSLGRPTVEYFLNQPDNIREVS